MPRFWGLFAAILAIFALLSLGDAPAVAFPSPTDSRISVSTFNVQGNGTSAFPSASDDGRFVAFQSVASNLVAGDTNGVADVFLRDRRVGTTSRVSVTSGGGQASLDSFEPSLSPDGNYVAFASIAPIPPDTNGTSDIFVRNVSAGTTSLISVAPVGIATDHAGGEPGVSNGGRYVVFASSNDNMSGTDNNADRICDADCDTNGKRDIFVRDTVQNKTTRVSVATDGGDADSDSFWPVISGNGRFVGFFSRATNLVASDTNGFMDAFVRDTTSNTTMMVSVGSGGQGNGDSGGFDGSYGMSISYSGRYVAFYSEASNLVPGDTNGAGDIFVNAALAGTTSRVSVTSAGAQGTGTSDHPSISGDGRFVAFASSAVLAPGGSAGIYVHDRGAGTTSPVTAGANGSSFAPSISGGGCAIMFSSDATNLVASDTNFATDVFANGGDLDGDSLCDEWEQTGIDYDNDGSPDYTLPGADFMHKDVYVEIDYMDCSVGGGCSDSHDHRPDAAAIQAIVDAFDDAPVGNPDGVFGITLHVTVDEGVSHANKIGFMEDVNANCPAPYFDNTKSSFFGTMAERGNFTRILAKGQAYHYTLFAHDLEDKWSDTNNDSVPDTCRPNRASGITETPGNDILITLGTTTAAADAARRWGTTIAAEQTDREAGTFMHELGHSLGLFHGGGDKTNCKPNYLSVMRYGQQYNEMGLASGLPSIADGTEVRNNRPIDYSRVALGTLFESHLNETTGVGGPSGQRTIFGGAGGAHLVGTTSGAIDWDDDGSIETDVPGDPNFIFGRSDCEESLGQPLVGYDDWNHLAYNFRNSPDFQDGDARETLAEVGPEETSVDYLNGVLGSTDPDLDSLENDVDNCPMIANLGQADGDTDTVGDPCDNCPATSNASQANQDGDASGDACDNCPSVSTPWVVPPGDSDCDFFTNTQEMFVGTNSAAWCGTDAWPLDLTNDQVINISDLSYFVGTINSTPPGPPYTARIDFTQDSVINISDLSYFVGMINKTCTP